MKNSTVTAIIIAALGLIAGWYIGANDLVDISSFMSAEETEQASTTTPEISIQITPEEPALPSLEGAIWRIPDTAGTATINTETATGSENILYTASYPQGEGVASITVIDNQLHRIEKDMYVVPFVISTSRIGTELYLGVVSQEEETLVLESFLLVGTRVGFETLEVERNTVTIATLAHHTDQPTDEDPQTPTTHTYRYRSGELVLDNIYRNVPQSAIEIETEGTASGTLFLLDVQGRVPESWFFEGDLPLSLYDGESLIASAPGTQTETGTLQGQITAEDLRITDDTYLRLVVSKNNPSDDRSLDASYSQTIAE